jgi:hypothetical protein
MMTNISRIIIAPTSYNAVVSRDQPLLRLARPQHRPERQKPLACSYNMIEISCNLVLRFRPDTCGTGLRMPRAARR